MIILFFINKIKKYYSCNKSKRNSILFLIEDFQNTISNPLDIYYNNKKYFPSENFIIKNKINLNIISTRKNLLKECEGTVKPNLNGRQWYDIPDEMYMQNDECIFEPLFTSKIPDEENTTEIKNNFINDNHDDYYDKKLKNYFKPNDRSSSDKKDADYDRNKNNIEIILHQEINHKKMFYTPKNESEVKNLYKIFSHNTFNNLMDKLEKKGDRQGVICILAGNAGTGKTETVLQLAKSCKRNLVKYDATQISVGIFGVAAEKVKEIFDSYKKAVNISNNYPILFINEADSIFSRRMEMGHSSNSAIIVDENRTQTVLLESLENFKGILLATANNLNNFDPAFERRFLYKINFEKPDKNARLKILKNMLPELSEEELIFIVNNYDLTGAQIENISRKIEINKIINDNFSFDDIKKLCKDETDNCFTLNNKPIGFK